MGTNHERGAASYAARRDQRGGDAHGVGRAAHWDNAYRNRGAEEVSWFQSQPTVSLELLDRIGATPTTSVIDVGGGASSLVDRLVARGFSDLTVLDVSEEALDVARQRLPHARVMWLRDDVLGRRPTRRYDVWHDRAVFHFLTDRRDQVRYLETLDAALAPAGSLIMATFAQGGPEYCSGLPVARYSASDLSQLIGAGFEVLEARREEHTTPSGVVQPFTWIAARRAAEAR